MAKRNSVVSKKTFDIKWFFGAFIILLLIFYGLNLRLFLHQAYTDNFEYMSDIKSYIDAINGIDNGDDYTYPIFFVVCKLISNIVPVADAVAITAAFFNTICIPILTSFFFRHIRKNGNMRFVDYCLCLSIPYCLLMISMLYNPVKIGDENIYQYLGVFTPNPWHNHTYLAARPFAIIAFLIFMELLDGYESKVDLKRYLVFSIALLFSTMTKPSFSLAFGSASFIFLLCNLFIKRFKILKNTLFIGIAFLPTVIDLLYQYAWGPFGSHSSQGDEAGIGIKFNYIWSLYSDNLIKSILLALLFVIVVTAINMNQIKKSRRYLFSMIFVVISMFEFMLLYEKGSRFWHANFSWGYMYGMFFAFLESVLLLLDRTQKKENSKIVLSFEWGVLLLHLLAGLGYFIYLQTGGSYMNF